MRPFWDTGENPDMCQTTRQDDVFTYEVVQTLMSAPQIEEQMREVIAAFQKKQFLIRSADSWCISSVVLIRPSRRPRDATLRYIFRPRRDDRSARCWMNNSLTRSDMKIVQLCIWQILLETNRKSIDWDIVKMTLRSWPWTYFLRPNFVHYLIAERVFSIFLSLTRLTNDQDLLSSKNGGNTKNPDGMIQTEILVEKCPLRRVVTCLNRTKTKIHITDPCTLNLIIV